MLRRTILGLLGMLAVAAGSVSALAQGTAFTYQGQLRNAGAAVSTPTDMQFSLWTSATGGTQIGSTVTQTSVPLSQGLFNTSVDFGVSPYTSSQALWLQIDVRNPSGTGSYVPMSARQLLTPAPFSLATRGLNVDSAGRVGVGTTPSASLLTLGGGAGLYPPAAISLAPSSDVSSERAAINIDNWSLLQDITGDGTRNFSIYERSVDGHRLSIAPGGNVGIGTASPVEKLSVSGGALSFSPGDLPLVGMDYDSTSDSLRFRANVGSAALNATNMAVQRVSGNVGIGTTAPNAKLNVASSFGNGPEVPFRISAGDQLGNPHQYGLAIDSYVVGNSNIGWNFITNNNSNFVVAMNLSGDGNVGIGRASPTHKLDVLGDGPIVAGTSASRAIRAQSNQPFGSAIGIDASNLAGGKMWDFFATGGTAGEGQGKLIIRNDTDLSNVMTLTGIGRVGIGTTNPERKLDVSGEAIFDSNVTSRNGAFRVWGQSANTAAFLGRSSSNPNRGSLLVLDESNSVRSVIDFSPTGVALVQTDQYFTNSDARLKTNIRTIESGLSKVLALRGVTFNHLRSGKAGSPGIGFVAQEVENVVPQLVSTGADGLKSVQYANITALTVEAIRELREEKNTQLAEMGARLAERDAEIAALKARLEKIESLLAVQAGEMSK